MIYGHDKTIHGTQHLNVEVDSTGKVVAVWFRCMMLPFTEHIVDDRRAEEMRRITNDDLSSILAVEVE